MTDANDYPPYIDHRDAQIVDACIVGEVYPIAQLRRTYKQLTDIRRDSTAENRAKTLVDTPAFEYESVGRFKFVGVGDE